MEASNQKLPKGGGKSLPSWRELSKEEQCVLFSAAEQSMLIGVLANWEPEQDWPHRRMHIPRLAEAAQSLLLTGLIDVYEQHVGLDDAALLFRDDALAIIRDPGNWWREDAEEESAGADGSTCQTTFYSLAITDEGGEVLHTRGDDNLYAYLDH